MKKLLLLFLFVAIQTKPMGLFNTVVESNQNNSGLGDLALKVGVVGAATIGVALLWEKCREPVTNRVRKTLGLQVQPTVEGLQTQIGDLQNQLHILQERLQPLESDTKDEDEQGPSQIGGSDDVKRVLEGLKHPDSPASNSNRRQKGSTQQTGNDSPENSPGRKASIEAAIKQLMTSEED